MNKSALLEYKVIFNEEDRTPRSLIDDKYEKIENNVYLSEITKATPSLARKSRLSIGLYKSIEDVTQPSEVLISENMMDLKSLLMSMDKELDHEETGEFVDEKKDTLEIKLPPTSRITLKLVESPTLFLLNRPSKTVDRRTTEFEEVEKDNARYEYLTVGKGRNRKVTTVGVQTQKMPEQTRSVLVEYPEYKNIGVMASPGDIFDNIKKIEISDLARKQETKTLETFQDEGTVQIIKAECEAVKLAPPSLMEQMQKIVKSSEFKDAVMKMERVLASNTYHEQQKLFQSSTGQDPFNLLIEFPYNMEYLWTFTCDTIKGRTVTSICWNEKNKDILAAGYGKFHFTDERNGLVCCWSVKNPCRPEREFKFDSTVTSIDFSKDRPNLLSVGLYDGTIAILDVSTREKNVISVSNRVTSPSFEALWKVSWYKAEEQIIACCQDGRIFRFRNFRDLSYVPLMHVTRVEGKVPGIEQTKRCKVPEIPVSRYSAALTLTRHPTNPLIYFLGTDEGCVFKCSTNHLNFPLDYFLAHDGPIYGVQISPFCSELLITCGADSFLRIWADGITDPLITFSVSAEAMLDACWSPIHGTVIATISGSDVYLWDINSKSHHPASKQTTPSSHRNTVVCFSPNGYNLLVGDSGGNIHVYALTGMPFTFYDNLPHIFNALVANLNTKPELLQQVLKLREKYKT